MKRIIFIAILFSAFLMGCTSLHDNKGWEHTGDSETHQDSEPYVLKHEH